MPGTKGNTNAEKWTLEKVEEFLEKILEIVKNDKKCSSMAAATTELGYYEKLIPYLKNKYKDVDFNPIKEAEDIIKARLIQKGLENEYNPTMSIFILKNNHGMKEKTENINTNLNTEPLTQEEIDERKKQLDQEY